MIKVRQNIKCIKDNRGFSIVELIIAIAIFAIASVPLLQALAKASKTNISAQNIQNATSVAEAAMEKIKATSIERLSAESGITYDESCLSTSDPSFFAKEDMTESEINSCIGHFSGKSLHKEADGFYVYYEPDVSSNNSEDKYDVIATIDTTVNTGKEYGDDSVVNAANANVALLPILAKIDSDKSIAISTEINKYDESAEASLIDAYKDKKWVSNIDGAVFSEPVLKEVEKYTTLNVDKDSVTGEITVEAWIEYKGKFDGLAETIEYKPKNIYKSILDEINESETEIYLFYRCMSENKSELKKKDPSKSYIYSVAKKETIKYTNNTNIKCNLIFDGYTVNGNKYQYEDVTDVTKNAEVIIDSSSKAFDKIYCDGTSTHLYDMGSDEYIYLINVCVIKDGKVCAYLTSTKEVERPTPTETPTPTPTIVPGG